MPTNPTQPATSQPATTPSSDTYTMTFTNNYKWGSVNCYYWSDSNKTMASWPGKAMTKSTPNEYGQDVYTLDIPSEAAYVIFNDGNNQTEDIPVIGSARFYISGSSNGKYTVKNR